MAEGRLLEGIEEGVPAGCGGVGLMKVAPEGHCSFCKCHLVLFLLWIMGADVLVAKLRNKDTDKSHLS